MKSVLSVLKSRCLKSGCDLLYDVSQTKAKIKRCQKITCHLAEMTVKTSSGIKRFQEEKCSGKWFNKLLPVVMSVPNCQPDLATDPGQLSATPARSQEDENSDGTSGETLGNVEMPKGTFVPSSGRKRPPSSKNKELGETLENIDATIEVLTSALEVETQNSAQMLKIMEDDAKRQEKRDDEFSMFMRIFVRIPDDNAPILQSHQPPPQCDNSAFRTHANYHHSQGSTHSTATYEER